MKFTGNLLISPPIVRNSFWHKTVILITEHGSNGTLGLVLNKSSNLNVIEFGKQLNMILNVPGMVYLGGPINSQSLSLLHTNDWHCKNTMQINEHFSISSADDILPRLSSGDAPRQWRLLLGMCGWAPGQLSAELMGVEPYKKETSWITATADLDLVFDTDGHEQWCSALDQSAREFAQSILL